MCRLQADIASAVIQDVFPAISIFVSCSQALTRELALRWNMIIAPPNESIVLTGAQPASRNSARPLRTLDVGHGLADKDAMTAAI
jgi:hypothetical protein